MNFKNGFLYHVFSISKLEYRDICPMIEEVRKFQVDPVQIKELGYDDPQDEWDLLSDATLLKTIRNDTRLQIQVGDRCRAVRGQFKNCTGIVQSIIDEQNGLAVLKTEDRHPIQIKVLAQDLEKFFTVGESVRVLQGAHAGEPGTIIDIV